MNFSGRADDLGPPPPVFRIGRRERFPRGTVRYLILLASVLVLYTVAGIARSIYADWLWFDSLGFASVYGTAILTQIWLFFAGAGVFLAFAFANLAIARRLAPQAQLDNYVSELDPATLRRIATIGLIAAVLFFAVIFGSVAAGEWTTVLRLFHGTNFALADPVFKRNVAFYVFTLPALRFFQSWLLGAVIVVLLGVVGIYTFAYGLQNFTLYLGRAIKMHVGLLLILLLLLFDWSYVLSIYELDFSSSGIVYGATYTDLHARLPAYLVLIALAALTALLILFDILRDDYLLAILGVGLWLVALVFGLAVYPAFLQRLAVQPNELNKEQTYIQRNINMTRTAYGLDRIDTQDYAADASVSAAQVQANTNTIDNIRLWDPRPLLDTYSQLQEIRPLYVFPTVSVDRYTIGGEYRELTLSPRELDQSRLAANARSWVNTATFFTHGYGAVVSPVNEADAGGLPVLLLKDIPPTGEPSITEPRIYFGMKTDPYVIVHTRNQEFDYPQANGDALTTYSADSGVALSSLLRRFVYAWEFGDINILISNQITSESRLLYRRNIQDRIQQIAPFLQLDHDPYVVISNGSLYWIQDAYTTTDQFPYSQPNAAGFNYIRNSVKIVINAYTGETTFYLVDPSDPIAATYAAIFPALFRPFDQMPAGLRQHVRYPQDLFEVQSDMYRAYHMQDARTFFNKEDLWEVPQEVLQGQAEAMQPYYVIMQLPGESKEEFVLIRPFTPAGKTNAIAFFAGRSDGSNYGKSVVYVFPKSKQVFGPRQIEARIDQTPAISSQFTLWDQSGSRVVRGNLLMIPIANSYLYVEPVYLQAEQSQLPELQRVIVVDGEQIAMETTLAGSLSAALNGIAPTPVAAGPPTRSASATNAGATAPPAPNATAAAAAPSAAAGGAPAPTATDVAGLAREASADYDQAQQQLRQGNLAGYQQAIDRMKAVLDRIVQLSGTPASGP